MRIAVLTIDDWRYMFHNYHETEQQCKDRKEALNIQAELESMADYTKPWPFHIQKGLLFHYLFYDHTKNEFCTMNTFCKEFAFYGFRTEERAKKALDTIGQDRLKFMRLQGVSV